MRCYHETSYIVQWVRIPPGPGGARPSRSHAVRRSWKQILRCVGMRTGGPWDCGPETYASRMPRVLFSLQATTLPCEDVWGRRGRYPAGCSTMARTQRTVPYPGRPSPRLDASRSGGEPGTRLRRTARMRAHGSSAQGAQHKRPHRGKPRQGEPERWPTGAGSRRAAEERRRRGTGWHPDPAEHRRPVLRGT
jgi:hypothetical protein